MQYKKIVGQVAELQHEQWLVWSREVARLIEAGLPFSAIKRKWVIKWKEYNKLSRVAKEEYREIAEKVFDVVPIRCPVYQCSGFMRMVEKKYPKGMNEDDFPDGMPGDVQTPDLVCENCRAVYEFQGFGKRKKLNGNI